MNRPGSAPICDATLDVAFKHLPVPAGCRHNIEVADLQLLMVHCVTPMEIVGDVSAGPKFVPDSVSVAPPVVGPLTGRVNVIEGAVSGPFIETLAGLQAPVLSAYCHCPELSDNEAWHASVHSPAGDGRNEALCKA